MRDWRWTDCWRTDDERWWWHRWRATWTVDSRRTQLGQGKRFYLQELSLTNHDDNHSSETSRKLQTQTELSAEQRADVQTESRRTKRLSLVFGPLYSSDARGWPLLSTAMGVEWGGMGVCPTNVEISSLLRGEGRRSRTEIDSGHRPDA